MTTKFLKVFSIVFLALALSACGKQNKNESKADKETVLTNKQQEKEKEKLYYKSAVQTVLNSNSEYAYVKGDTGVNVFIKGDEIICFIEVKGDDESIYSDIFFANVYRPGGKESLKFEFMDFEKDDIKINNVDYMLAAFKFSDVENASSIQVGQYNKEQKLIPWKVLIPKGRFHK